jgi:hypothetical protein
VLLPRFQKNRKPVRCPRLASFRQPRVSEALVDSERIITTGCAPKAMRIARKHDGADLVVVNTCGFLDSRAMSR